MPLTQAQLVTAVADKAELSKADAKRAVEALETIVLEQLGNAEKVRIGGLVQLTVRVKPATKKRPAATRRPARRSPSPRSRPASTCVRVRSRRRRPRCRPCRRLAAGSPPDTGCPSAERSTPAAVGFPRRWRPERRPSRTPRRHGGRLNGRSRARPPVDPGSRERHPSRGHTRRVRRPSAPGGISRFRRNRPARDARTHRTRPCRSAHRPATNRPRPPRSPSRCGTGSRLTAAGRACRRTG